MHAGQRFESVADRLGAGHCLDEHEIAVAGRVGQKPAGRGTPVTGGEGLEHVVRNHETIHEYLPRSIVRVEKGSPRKLSVDNYAMGKSAIHEAAAGNRNHA